MIYEEKPWPQVMERPEICNLVIDQCMAGLMSRRGGFVKKPTGFVASHPSLLYFLRKFQCDGSHTHDQLAGGNNTAEAQIWPWRLARAIADGICKLIAPVKRTPSTSSYPAVATGTDDGPTHEASETPGSRPAWYDCPGCRGGIFKESWKHTRVPGVCKYPLTETVNYDCPACKKGYPQARGHTYRVGECRLWSISH